MQPDEQKLLERLQQHDERAFNEVVEAYEQRVFRLVYGVIGRREEAEDLVQDVFVQVFKAVPSFRGDSKLSTWIYRIAINLCSNRRKYLKRRYTHAQDELEPALELGQEASGLTSGESARPDQVLQGRQLEEIVRSCIQTMDDEFREALILRDLEGLSYDEIAEITGLAPGTVKSRIHRARTMLKERVARALREPIE